jgi:hypothetical protein
MCCGKLVETTPTNLIATFNTGVAINANPSGVSLTQFGKNQCMGYLWEAFHISALTELGNQSNLFRLSVGLSPKSFRRKK